MTISAALAACGSGGGSTGSTSPGVSGPATVSVSVASAPDYPAGTMFASSTLSPATAAPPANSPTFDNVIVTVTKLALIPSTGPEFPDANGESEMPNSSAEEGKSGMSGFVTTTFAPVKIDLLHPPAGDNVNVAALMNEFSEVPAGEYSKIRVYYENVVGQKEGQLDMKFHPTANYHFDVHFVGGNLVIPESTDTQGVRFYSVVIKLVGLKYHQAGQSGNVLLRPQVFATVEGSPEYIVTGVADKVATINYDGTFDIILTPGGRTICAAFSDLGTTWAYSDNVLQDPQMVIGRTKEIAVPAFNDNAIVSAIGVFDAGGCLQASHITFTFPVFRIGEIFSSWSLDNTSFSLNLPSDNLVYAIPDKRNPLYTNFRVPPLELLNGYDLIIFPNLDNTVKARGYANYLGSKGFGLRAFWISIDNNIVP
jgi:hypothetical protein